MIVLDTHVVPELLRPAPAAQVEAWLDEDLRDRIPPFDRAAAIAYAAIAAKRHAAGRPISQFAARLRPSPARMGQQWPRVIQATLRAAGSI